MRRRQFLLSPQFYYCYGFPAAIFGLGPHDAGERMRREESCEAFAQRARAVAMNDADAFEVRQGGLVEKFVDAICGFFDGGTDYVEFVGGCGFAGA